VIDSDGTVNSIGCVLLAPIWLGLAIHNRTKEENGEKNFEQRDDQQTLSTADYMHEALSMAPLRMRKPIHVASVDYQVYIVALPCEDLPPLTTFN
jgi:hypothetical protein